MPPQSADEYDTEMMVSQGLDQRRVVVKRHRSFQHHHHSTGASGISSLTAAEGPLGDNKKKRNVFLDRTRGNVVRQLLSSRARLFVMFILLMAVLLPIYTFHTARLSSPSSSTTSSSESSQESSPTSSSTTWSSLLSARRASTSGVLRRSIRTRKTEPRSLYGGHYRAVDYAAETNAATRAVFNQTSSSSFPKKKKQNSFEFLAHHNILPPPPLYHVIDEPLTTNDQLIHLANSEDYAEPWANLEETDKCKAQFEWQKGIIATCNLHHELDMTVFSNSNKYKSNNQQLYHSEQQGNFPVEDEDESLRLLASGHRRDVWVFDAPATPSSSSSGHNVSSSSAMKHHNSNKKLVLKTQRWRWEFDMSEAERHRQDAIAMERLTSSPFILNAYSSCANSAMTEYAQGGTMEEKVSPTEERNRSRPQQASSQRNTSSSQRTTSSQDDKLEILHMAFQAAKGLEALHTLGRGGPFGTRTLYETDEHEAYDEDSQQPQHVPPFGPTIAHTDISTDQFVRVGDVWKLNDFNRGPFILGDFATGKTCPYTIDYSGGNYRSPEEYRGVPLTAQIDVYSLGNVFYQLLTGHEPFEDDENSSLDSAEEDEVKKRIVRGERPPLPQEILASDNIVDKVLQKAMRMAFRGDPNKRATASEIATLLQAAMQQVDPGRLEQWGVVVKVSSKQAQKE